jgi:hypothetical protein
MEVGLMRIIVLVTNNQILIRALLLPNLPLLTTGHPCQLPTFPPSPSALLPSHMKVTLKGITMLLPANQSLNRAIHLRTLSLVILVPSEHLPSLSLNCHSASYPYESESKVNYQTISQPPKPEHCLPTHSPTPLPA